MNENTINGDQKESQGFPVQQALFVDDVTNQRSGCEGLCKVLVSQKVFFFPAHYGARVTGERQHRAGEQTEREKLLQWLEELIIDE